MGNSVRDFIKKYLEKHSFGNENDAARETYNALKEEYANLRQGRYKRLIRTMWLESNDQAPC